MKSYEYGIRFLKFSLIPTRVECYETFFFITQKMRQVLE